jgi:AAA domain/Bifunctional DNA primase/polymerase, N-terminal
VSDAVAIGLAYLATGWMNLAPANGKRPALAEWGELEFRPPTEAEVRRIWGGPRPPGFGLFLGDRAAAVDVDVRAAVDGRDTMHELEREHGELPLSPRALSPSEGFHHFLAIPEGVDRAQLPTKLGEGVALRHGRLFMALPPAPGRDWEHDPEETPLAPLPQWIIDLGRVGEGAGKGTQAAPQGLVPHGERHDYLLDAGLHFVRGGIVDEAVLLDHLLLEYERRCVQQPPREPGGIERLAHDLAHGKVAAGERVTMGFAARMLGYRRPAAEQRQNGGAPAGPFSLPVAEFVAAKHDAPPALIGTDDDCLLPARGLGMIVGRGGKGKTSLVVDLALHAAAGVDWLGIPIGRPLRVLLLENEGPREMFRRKLERRLASWEHELDGRLHVHVQSWAGFKLEDAGVAELNRACDELGIDLVIGDPLDSLGMEGEGSPSEARRMVDRLKAAGLAALRAWLLLHHTRKANDVDAVDAASGDWGGRPDLSPQTRQARGQPRPAHVPESALGRPRTRRPHSHFRPRDRRVRARRRRGHRAARPRRRGQGVSRRAPVADDHRPRQAEARRHRRE